MGEAQKNELSLGCRGECKAVTIVTKDCLHSGLFTVQILATSAQNHVQLSLNAYLSKGQKSA